MEKYYVSVRDASKYGLLLGPFSKHEYAIARVERVREQACKVNDRAWFYAFGTCKVASEAPGILNEYFPDAPYAPANRETDEYDTNGSRTTEGT